MCADSTMVFRRAEESIHCLRKGTEMKMWVRTTTALFMSAIAIALTAKRCGAAGLCPGTKGSEFILHQGTSVQ